MFLTNMTRSSPHSSLSKAIALLPSPLRPLHGRRTAPLALPDNIICFRRSSAQELNKPQRGRALHHRYVLIIPLQTAVTVCVDEKTVRLKAGEGLLISPFQFHDYIDPEAEELNWLFITFEHADGEALQGLRYRPFQLTSELSLLATELVAAYLSTAAADLTALLLAVFLERVRRMDPQKRHDSEHAGSPGLLAQVNQLTMRSCGNTSVKEMARSIGISASHLRARFRASCGVSLGRHMRRLRLEKACGLLRMSQKRVSEVGELCGFSSIYSFSRAFHAEYGISPLAYRHGEKPRKKARR